jgi:poly-beta-1,6-N-acetyl-D-glucosamine synthase
MLYLLLFLFGLHLTFLLLLLAGLEKAMSPQVLTEAKGFVSVIVPFRNEADSLPVIIKCLQLQAFRDFEVILVDDESSDNSYAVAASLIAGDRHFKLIQAKGSGKKNALTEGIGVAQGEIIATTDADCVMGSEWINEILGPFDRKEIQMVFGPVMVKEGTDFFSKIQVLEFAGVIGTGIAAFGLGYPLYCNGANLAYRKSVFKEVNGYQDNLQVSSGDDEFLLKNVAEKYGGAIHFINNSRAVVTTRPQARLDLFVHQRIRWSSKWRHTPGLTSKLLAVLTFLIQCAVLMTVVAVLFGTSSHALIFLLGSKILLEYIFLFRLAFYFKLKFSFVQFLVLEMVYPFYVLYIGIMCNFSSYRWKGRKLDR